MPSRHDRIRWPVAALVACVLLALLLTATERWLWRGRAVATVTGAWVPETGWLTVLPPPMEIEPDDERPRRADAPRAPAPAESPWWQWAWQERIDRLAATVVAAPAPADSARLLLDRLGIEPDLAARARPDSALAARLIWLSRREGYLPQDIRPVLRALGRAQAYRAIASRAAALYEEFLAQEIITTD